MWPENTWIITWPSLASRSQMSVLCRDTSRLWLRRASRRTPLMSSCKISYHPLLSLPNRSGLLNPSLCFFVAPTAWSISLQTRGAYCLKLTPCSRFRLSENQHSWRALCRIPVFITNAVLSAHQDGGELYFSDIYSSGRLPEQIRNHKVLWGKLEQNPPDTKSEVARKTEWCVSVSRWCSSTWWSKMLAQGNFSLCH